MTESNLVNWQDFEMKSAENRIELKNGVKLELGFRSIKQFELEVTDNEKTAEGKIEVKKKIPALKLEVDSLDGKPCVKELVVTSKKLTATIRTYFEKGMLFKRIFQIEKTGEGYQTSYQFIALQDKPEA